MAPGGGVGLGHEDLLKRWLVSAQPNLSKIDAGARLELYTQPVFLLHNPGNRDAPFAAIEALRDGLRRRKQAPDWLQIAPTVSVPGSRDRLTAYRRIGEFFNVTLYTFTVKVGDETVVPEGLEKSGARSQDKESRIQNPEGPTR